VWTIQVADDAKAKKEEEEEEEEEEEDEDEGLADYEKERLARIKQNQQFLINLGIDSIPDMKSVLCHKVPRVGSRL
jgi:hypothetical protein